MKTSIITDVYYHDAIPVWSLEVLTHVSIASWGCEVYRHIYNF